MGKRHNDLTPHIEVGRTRAKRGAWTRKRVKQHRALAAVKHGHAKTPGAARQEKEAKRQSSVQAFMRYMDKVKYDDFGRKKRLEREREEQARGEAQAARAS